MMQNDRSLGKWRANDKIPGYIEHSINPRVCVYIYFFVFSSTFYNRDPHGYNDRKSLRVFSFSSARRIRVCTTFTTLWWLLARRTSIVVVPGAHYLGGLALSHKKGGRQIHISIENNWRERERKKKTLGTSLRLFVESRAAFIVIPVPS